MRPEPAEPPWVPTFRLLAILSCAAYAVLEVSRSHLVWLPPASGLPLANLSAALHHQHHPQALPAGAGLQPSAAAAAAAPAPATGTGTGTGTPTPSATSTASSAPPASETPTPTPTSPPAPSPEWPCDADAVKPRPWFRPRGRSCAEDFPGSLSPPVPLEDSADLPPQSDIPLYITSNNNPTFLWYWLRLTECYGIPLRIYDQVSTFPPLLALLKDIEAGAGKEPRYRHAQLVRNAENRGPRFFFDADMLAGYPPYYAITDPDLVMRPDLPSNWLRVMARISQVTRLSRVAAALDVTSPADMWRVPYHVGMTVEAWEAPFWKARFAPSDMPPELANLSSVAWVGGVDTTLAVYHPSGPPHAAPEGMRLAGPFMAAHVPWYHYFLDMLMPGELQAQYVRGSTLAIGSNIGKMMISNGIMRGELLRYEPGEWNVSYDPGAAWEAIATSRPANSTAALKQGRRGLRPAAALRG